MLLDIISRRSPKLGIALSVLNRYRSKPLSVDYDIIVEYAKRFGFDKLTQDDVRALVDFILNLTKNK